MKITLAVTGIVVLALVSADTGFKPPKPEDNKNGTKPGKRIKTAANFANGGAKIDLCPSGDCEKGQLIRLGMSRLEEFDPSGNAVNNKAESFASLNTEWTPMDQMVVNNVTTTSTSFLAQVAVGPNGRSGTARFNLTATIYNSNSTTMNGNQTIPVPAGALKFTVSISNWPFKSSANHLRFGVTLRARGKDGKDRSRPEKKPKKHSNGTDAQIDRVDMGEGMFMDAPAQAVLDGVQGAINATVSSEDGKVEYFWDFPYFNKTLYYDPVVGSEDETALPTDDSTPTTEAPTPAPTTTKNGSASWKVISGIVAGVSALAIAFL